MFARKTYCTAILVIILSCITAGALHAAELHRLEHRYTPPAWKASPVQWIGDLDRNKIDDAIDTMQVGNRVNILVNYSDCLGDSDVATLEAMAAPGSVSYVSRFLSSVAVDSTTAGQVAIIAQDPTVAFIELQGRAVPTLDVSVPNICVTSGAISGCPSNAEALGYDGTGINIAIMDTGVDEGVDTFGAGQFQGGYNAHTSTFENPVDDVWHGTHVASIALGQGGVRCPRGVAPGSGLYDVKCIPALEKVVFAALETIYDEHQNGNWTVHVINGSFGFEGPGQVPENHDGTEAFAQLIDLAESIGILFVAAVGNSGPNNTSLSNPAAATRALAVAASDDLNIADRGDILADFSNRGKRADDGDGDVYDEMKPEVTAPGVWIKAALVNVPDGARITSGTSQAAPHVAGLAALIRQAQPTINVSSLRDLIISTAEDLAGNPSDPLNDPIWNDGWGWGLVNAYAALDTVTVPTADLSFPHHPYVPGWYSPDISVTPAPQAGNPTTVTVDIENRGSFDAVGARIKFGVHDYSASTKTFQDIGTKIIDIAANTTQSVSIDWTPWQSGHQCMQVEIGYGQDTDFSNNIAVRNLTVTASPVYFQVENNVSADPVTIHFETEFAVARDPQWTVSIEPSILEMAAEDCPRQIEVNMGQPLGVAYGDSQIVHIRAMAGGIEIGGVSVLDVAKDPTAVGDERLPLPVFTVDSYPNPFNPQITFEYFQPMRGQLSLKVFDLRGVLVAVVIDEIVEAGRGTVAWNGTDIAGQSVSSGAYFYSAWTGDSRRVGKIMLIR